MKSDLQDKESILHNLVKAVSVKYQLTTSRLFMGTLVISYAPDPSDQHICLTQ